MTEPTQLDPSTLRTQLNRIASYGASTTTLPNGTTLDEVTDYAHDLHDRLETQIQRYDTDSPLSRSEAELWALRHSTGQQNTQLTCGAIALVLTPDDTPFTALASAIVANTAEAVEQYLAHVDATVDRATDVATAVTAPPPEATPEHPTLAVLDSYTKHRLQNAAAPDEHSLDTVLSRLLDEQETCLPLEQVCEQYLHERGRDVVRRLEVQKFPLQLNRISLTAIGPDAEDIPAVVSETDAVTIAGRRFDLEFEEQTGAVLSLGRIPIYDTNLDGETTVHLETGLTTLRDKIQTLTDSDTAHTPGTPSTR